MRSQRGYSLIEVLVAFVILTFVITLSFAAFLERNKRMQQASEIMLAYQALSNESEYWRRKGFSTLQTQTTFDSDLTLIEPLKPYVTTATVVNTSPTTKSVTLLIKWHDGQREAKLGLVRVDTGSAGGLW
jgi:prepilin-type N-terminal cleavage/methylation domain-containing protein